MRFSVLMAASLIPLAAFSDPVPEKPTDKIIVTGEFRDTGLDKLPASVSVIGADEIEARGAHHLEDVLGAAANVNIAGGSTRSRFFQIRGIGERGQFIEPLNPSVGLIVDGVDLSDSAAAATLFDVDQVEIFRGPQGTRYGANALAGLINVVTRGPSETFQADASADLADYGTWSMKSAVSTPLSDSVGVRFAAQTHSSNGFMRNTYLGRKDTNGIDEQSFRGKLHWKVSDTTTLDTMVGYIDVDNGYDAFSLDNDRRTRSDQPGRDAQKTLMGSAQLDWNGGDAFGVQTSAAATSSKSTYGYDEDWTFVGFDPEEYSSTDYYFRKRHNVTAEVKILSKDGGRLFGGTTDWVAGAYGMKRSEDQHREYTFASGPFRSRFDVDRFAAFGELKTALGSRNTLTAGARYEQHKADYLDSDALAFSPTDDLYGWRVNLDHTLRESLMAYAGIARGYKAGGFNTDGTLDADLRQFQPETLMNYEIGVKGRFLDRRLAARVALFYMDRHDMQVPISTVRQRGDGTSEFIIYTDNASGGTNAGVETELSFRATDALTVSGSFGLLDSKYRGFINAAGYDLDGREQAHAPEYQFAVRAHYAFNASWYADLGASGRDDFYYSDDNDARSRAYALLDASIGFTRGNWEAKIWARNLTDEDYAIRGYVFANDPRDVYAVDHVYTQLGAPRQAGITVNWSF